MTDRERYKRTFSRLHASGEILMEVKTMQKIKIMPIRRFLAVAAAALLIAAMATVAYAADVGGIRRHFQIWLNDGTPVEVEFSMPDGEMGKYTASYKDADGNEQIIYGEITSGDTENTDVDTDSEVMASLNAPQVEYRDDGSVWVHHNGKDIEITDLFEDGVCQLELENEQFELEDGEVQKSLYLTIQYGEGYTSSSDGFVPSIGGDHGSTWVWTDEGAPMDADEVEAP